MNNTCTECVGSMHEEDDKITDYSVKGENCKHRWEAKEGSSKYITTMAISNYYYTIHDTAYRNMAAFQSRIIIQTCCTPRKCESTHLGMQLRRRHTVWYCILGPWC